MTHIRYWLSIVGRRQCNVIEEMYKLFDHLNFPVANLLNSVVSFLNNASNDICLL